MSSQPERDWPELPPNVIEVTHNLAQHKLTLLRDRSRHAEVDREKFRRLMREIGLIMCSEVTRNLELKNSDFNIDVDGRSKFSGKRLEQPKIVVIPVIRGGLILADSFFELLPMARGGHLGLFREYENGISHVTNFFTSIPSSPNTDFFIIDPVIGASSTIRRAIQILLDIDINPSRISIVSLVALREGLHRLYNDVDEDLKRIRIFTLAVDNELDEQGFLIPGLGDVGARLFGEIGDRDA